MTDLTEFAAFPFGSFFLDTLAEYDLLVSPEYLRRNMGVVITVGGLYAAFLLALALVRLQRTRQSMRYIELVNKTRYDAFSSTTASKWLRMM
jgi:hypothetical protein